MVEDELSGEICTINEIDPKAVAFVQSRALPNRTIERVNRLFSALADPTRIKILNALMVTDELCVCDLAVIADLSVSAVSHQLRLLRTMRLVKCRREGKLAYYALDDDHVRMLFEAGLHHIRE